MNLDDPVMAEILGRAMVARIATVSSNGRPHVNPLYFVCGKGRIHLGTTDRTLAARNVSANRRVTLLFNVEREPDDLRILRIDGNAVVRTDMAASRWYIVRDLRKYIFSRRGLVNTLAHTRLLPLVGRFVSSGEKGRACVLEVDPSSAELLTAPQGRGRLVNLA